MKLWQKDTEANKMVEAFTVGMDQELDLFLAEFDVLGSLAHTQMLESIGLLTKEELLAIHTELKKIFTEIQKGNFEIEAGVEDVHSQVELLLTKKLGDVGKKIHSGRSRNDQVLLDLKLFTRNAIGEIVDNVSKLFVQLVELSDTHQKVLLPGYTHLQVAMPSSFGLWFSAYAESLADDMLIMQSAYKITNKNPLGSAAGYGSSFPLNRTMTTELLGFDDLNYNVVYAQMGRGKTEKTVSMAMASVAATLSKMAMDICLYMSQNFGFVSFPDELTTGSSIMPHKKNPDVFELIRAKCNKLQALPNEITLIINNLPSGYQRDLQLLKESFLPAFSELNSCIVMANFMLENIQVNENILEDDKYAFLFSVEEVNKLVLEGVPFRDAYKQVGAQIDSGSFKPKYEISHTHEGSIGNLQTDKIIQAFEETLDGFNFDKIEDAYMNLLK